MSLLSQQESKVSLASSATSGFGWNLAGSVAIYGAGFAINIVLARILGPEPFGLVAVGLIFISLGKLFIDSGLNSGLVQKKEISKQDVHYVLTIQLALAVVIGGILVGLSPVIARLYRQPDLVLVLRILAITLLLQAASSPSVAVLRRKMAFKRVQQAQITSFLIGYLLLGIPLAYAGFGVWSLVLANVAQSLLYLGFVYGIARHPIGLNFHDPGKISRFGSYVLGANIANWSIQNFDNTSVGLLYGATTLGFYGRAWNLAITPVTIVVSSMQTVLFSASATLQQSAERVREVFLGVVALFGILIFPFCLCVSIMAYDWVQLAYGDKWSASAPILEILVLAMPFYALTALQGPVLAGLGHPEFDFRIEWIVVAFIAGVVVLPMFFVPFALQMIIWAVLVVYVFRFIALSLTTLKVLQISFQGIKAVLVSTMIFSSTVTPAVFLTRQLTRNFSTLARLSLEVLAALVVWILVFLIGRKHFLPSQFQSLARRVVPRRFAPFFADTH